MALTRSTDEAISVRGLRETQRAFRRIGGDLPKATRKALREIAKPVRAKAQSGIQHKTGRHSKDGPLRVKISATQRFLSVYSNEPYARVQDTGGHVGHGAIITRASASHYMTKAVQESRPAVEVALNELGNTIAEKFVTGAPTPTAAPVVSAPAKPGTTVDIFPGGATIK